MAIESVQELEFREDWERGDALHHFPEDERLDFVPPLYVLIDEPLYKVAFCAGKTDWIAYVFECTG